MMFLFFGIYCFLSTKYPINVRKILVFFLILGVVCSVGISHFKTPYYEERISVQEEALEVLRLVDGKFFVPSSMYIKSEPGFLSSKKAYSPLADNSLYDYGIIYYNLDTASTAQVLGSTPEEYSEVFFRAKDSFGDTNNCKEFVDSINWLNVTNVIAFNDDFRKECDALRECRFKEVVQKEHVCLFKTKKMS